jgi:hypothetical protein
VTSATNFGSENVFDVFLGHFEPNDVLTLLQ